MAGLGHLVGIGARRMHILIFIFSLVLHGRHSSLQIPHLLEEHIDPSLLLIATAQQLERRTLSRDVAHDRRRLREFKGGAVLQVRQVREIKTHLEFHGRPLVLVEIVRTVGLLIPDNKERKIKVSVSARFARVGVH